MEFLAWSSISRRVDPATPHVDVVVVYGRLRRESNPWPPYGFIRHEVFERSPSKMVSITLQAIYICSHRMSGCFFVSDSLRACLRLECTRHHMAQSEECHEATITIQNYKQLKCESQWQILFDCLSVGIISWTSLWVSRAWMSIPDSITNREKNFVNAQHTCHLIIQGHHQSTCLQHINLTIRKWII